MRASITFHLAHSAPRPVAKVWQGAPDMHFITIDDQITIHCRSEAQAILIADAINLPDAAVPYSFNDGTNSAGEPARGQADEASEERDPNYVDAHPGPAVEPSDLF